MAVSIVAYNLFLNPVLGGGSETYWYLNNGGATVVTSVVSSGGVDPAVPFRRAHFNTDSTSTSTFGQGAGSNAATYIAATAGLAYSASMWVRHNLAVARYYSFYLQYYDAAGALTGQQIPVTLVQPNTWTQLKYENYVAPAGTVRARILGYVSGAVSANNGVVPAGSDLDMTMPHVDQTTTIGGFFSGDTRGPGYVYAWTGTPHASTSTKQPAFDRTGSAPLGLGSGSAAACVSTGSAPLSLASASSAVHIIIWTSTGSAPLTLGSASSAVSLTSWATGSAPLSLSAAGYASPIFNFYGYRPFMDETEKFHILDLRMS